MADIFWKESECGNGWLHRFNTHQLYDRCIVELCETCRERIFIPVKNGEIDNVAYLDYHLREVLTPNYPQYFREYPQTKNI